MQILEGSVFGLRAARIRFADARSGQSVTLFPMVHVGEAAFYRAVYEDAFDHDVVLVEGVRSPIVRHITRSYRWIEGSKLGLVIQPRLGSADLGRARIVRADLATEEFEQVWRRIPLRIRLLVLLLAPLVGLHHRWFTTRAALANRLTLEDRLSPEEILDWDPAHAALGHGLLGARDARLVERLGAELDRPAAAGRRLAIVYGAAHMRAVLAELKARRFRCVESHWQTIFRLDD